MHVVQSEPPYFSASKNHPHILFCPYIAQSSFDPGRYNEKCFDMNEFIEHLFRPNDNYHNVQGDHPNYQDHEHSSALPIRTVRVLYNMCKDKDIDDSYNSVPIRNIIFDSRCDVVASNLSGSFRLVECQSRGKKFLNYDSNGQTITLFSPVNLGNRRIPFMLKFAEEDLYKNTQNKLFKNMGNHVFVVAGKWEKFSLGEGYVTTIENKRQVIVIN